MSGTYEVLLTAGAARDLAAICGYIGAADSRIGADYVLGRLIETAEGLSAFPERGVHPPELLALGVRDFRQIFFKPYRIIYRVVKRQVMICLIADGRREMQSLLERRLLQA